MGTRPFLRTDSAFPGTPVAVPSPPSAAIPLIHAGEPMAGERVVSWSPVSTLQAPGQPSSFQSVITEMAALTVPFETTWQSISLDLHKGRKTVRTSEALKEGMINKEKQM